MIFALCRQVQYLTNITIMKKILLILSAITFIMIGLKAQPVNTVKTDLFSPILRTFVIKYERAFTADITGQLGFFYTGFHPRESASTLNGFGITPEFRFYLSDSPAPDGTYLAPNFRYFNFTVKDPVEDESGTLTNASIAINIGKQVMFKDIIVFDAWIGPSYNFRNIKSDVADIDAGIPDVNGFGLRAGIAIGLAF